MGMAFMVFAVLFLEAFVLISLVLTCVVLCYAVNRIGSSATRKYGAIILVVGGIGFTLSLAFCLLVCKLHDLRLQLYFYSACFFMGFGWPGAFAYIVVAVLVHRRGLLQMTDLSKRRALTTLKITMVCFLVVLHCMSVVFIMAEPLLDIWSRDWSTNPPSAENIAATNKIRRERGVREIKDGWTFYGRRSGKEEWKDETGWGCKNVHYDRCYKEIRSECDYYYSGRTFTRWNRDRPVFREQLLITYTYGADRFALMITTDNKEIESMVDGLEERMQFQTLSGEYVGFGNMGETNEETLEVAEKILKMWGIERL